MNEVSRSKPARSYDYSPTHRKLEIFAIAAFFVLICVFSYRTLQGLLTMSGMMAAFVLFSSAILGYIIADFMSGIVHWMGDTFGDEDMPVLGAGFIKPFRDHHTDPLDITRHDFIEVNGNNSLVLLIVLLPALFIFKQPEVPWQAFSLSFLVWFAFGIFMTNQFHKWAHLEERPQWMKRLQAYALILSPENHNMHHTMPYDTYYCITNGWLNPILHRMRFFERAERLVRWTFRIPKQSL